MTTPSFSTLDKAVCAAYTLGAFPSHHLVCSFGSHYYVVPKNKVPLGYTKLKLNDIAIILSKQFDRINVHERQALASVVGYMGNRQLTQVYSGFKGFIRRIYWFFDSLFRCHISKIPAAKALDLQKRLIESIPPGAMKALTAHAGASISASATTGATSSAPTRTATSIPASSRLLAGTINKTHAVSHSAPSTTATSGIATVTSPLKPPSGAAAAAPSAMTSSAATTADPVDEPVGKPVTGQSSAAQVAIPTPVAIPAPIRIVAAQDVSKAPKEAVDADKFVSQKTKEDRKDFNVRVWEETSNVTFNGYKKGSNYFSIDNMPMLAGTKIFGKEGVAALPLLKDGEKFKTTFSVTVDDTLNVLLKHQRAGANAVGLVMANAGKPGGFFEDGCNAQEEDLVRRSNLAMGLESMEYKFAHPLPAFGGVYCPNVTVFRNDYVNHGYSFMDQPEQVDLVAVAAPDLNQYPDIKDILEKGVPDDKDVKPKKAFDKAIVSYVGKIMPKVQNMLRVMAQHETARHDTLVLGAFGCGVFGNPPNAVATTFVYLLNTPEFKGRFKHVEFAILDNEDSPNVIEFIKASKKLTALYAK